MSTQTAAAKWPSVQHGPVLYHGLIGTYHRLLTSAVPLHPQVSRSVLLHSAQTVLLLLLSHLSTLYLCIVVALAVGRQVGPVGDFRWLFNLRMPKEISLWPKYSTAKL